MNQLFYLISRYRQQKPCYVYRLVMDNTMERKIYDRQISKEVETDGVKSLVGDEEDPPPKDFDRNVIKNMSYPILGCVMDRWGKGLTQEPSQHDTLQLGGQESKLSKEKKENAERRYQQKNRRKFLNCLFLSHYYICFDCGMLF